MEKTIEIPFGAKDSELKGWEYTIPEGMEAEIKDGKIIVREKESDDERIRKRIISRLQYDLECNSNKFTKREIPEEIAYLERQKEQKPASGNSEKPNNHAEWSEDWREEDIQTRFAFYTYKDDPSVLYLSNVFVEEASRNHGFGTRILRAAEKVAEAIGATTISLKVKQDSPVNAWYRKNGYGYVTFEDGYDWLEKNLEYLKPKQKWSETDKLHLNNAILAAEKEWGAESCTAKFLKPLRPQPHWKPSKEQMKEYSYWYKNFIESGLASPSSKAVNVLGELLEQLKKL